MPAPALCEGKDSHPAALGSAEGFGLTQREELTALGYPVGVTSYHWHPHPSQAGHREQRGVRAAWFVQEKRKELLTGM